MARPSGTCGSNPPVPCYTVQDRAAIDAELLVAQAELIVAQQDAATAQSAVSNLQMEKMQAQYNACPS